MRCKLRYRAGWIAFLFIFSVAGLILTYRQINENQNDSLKFKQLPLDGSLLLNGKENVRIMKERLKSDEVRRPPVVVSELKVSHPDKIKKILKSLYPADWGHAKDADEMAIELKQELSDLGFDSAMSCKEIDMLRIQQPVKIGSKKFVDRALIKPNNKEVVVKSQGNDQDIKIKCMQQVYDAEKCHVMGNYMLMREILFMSLLKNPGIISPRGYCLRGDNIHHDMKKKGVILVLESGMPVNPASFSYIPWFNKLQYTIRLTKLLIYLEGSPLGSIGLVGIRMDDFVLVGDHRNLKLVDLDDLTFEEKTCKNKDECQVSSASHLQIPCEDGHCIGWNAKNNIRMLGSNLYNHLLENPPAADRNLVEALRIGILRVQFSAKEILQQLEELQKTAGQEMHHILPDQGEPQVGNVQLVEKKIEFNREELRRQEEIRQNKVMKDLPKETFTGDYRRHNQSNFPGMYDYSCERSRVTWGCVITVQSLLEAKAICNTEPQCRSFVLFTSNPDTEALMTMVAKNSGAGQPEPNAGATLFIRITEPGGIVIPSPVTINNSDKETEAECRIRTQAATADARNSREKRLMAHLGLKGTTEDIWKVHMKTSKIIRHNGYDSLILSSTRGGRFVVEMDKSVNNMKSAVFLAEFGPLQYHVAHFITYHVDRTLGLFHTPPTVPWFMKTADVADVDGEKSWPDQLGPYLANGEDIKGILAATAPRVIKSSVVFLQRRNSMVNSVQSFTRMEKLQLEYVFLWYLVKIQMQDDHLGYKGHLIQFRGDQAFQDLNVDLLGYFYHCQFPNIVYKALTCHKCHGGSSQHSSSICTLGQAVIQQVVSAGYSNTDINIHGFTPSEIMTVINDAASNVFSIVDTCIKKFGREQVLY